MLRQLLSCVPRQALSITLLWLADIHEPITDCVWIIHRRRWGAGCQSLLPNDLRCVWVSLSVLPYRKEGKRRKFKTSTLFKEIFILVLHTTSDNLFSLSCSQREGMCEHVWRYVSRFPLLVSEEHICTGRHGSLEGFRKKNTPHFWTQ